MISDYTFTNSTEDIVNTISSTHVLFTILHVLMIVIIIVLVVIYIRKRIKKRINRQLTQVVKFVKEENGKDEDEAEKIVLNTTPQADYKIEVENKINTGLLLTKNTLEEPITCVSPKVDIVASLNKNMEKVKEL